MGGGGGGGTGSEEIWRGTDKTEGGGGGRGVGEAREDACRNDGMVSAAEIM